MSPGSPPRVVGRYLLGDPIASGGMAAVHIGRALGVEGFSRTVAIKHLHAHFAQNDEFVAMLLDEARLLSRIRHSNVVAPLDVVIADGEVFIVVEYVHAETLSRIQRAADGPIPARIACAVMSQVLLGLHAAHEARGEGGQFLGIVHRDISPQNILVGQDGAAKIVDFGIAKAAWRAHTTHTGQLKGKPGYMAPEQRAGAPLDRRADVYTSGIVLWEMLTGHRLYKSTPEGVVAPETIEPPSARVPGLAPALDRAVLRSLSADPTDRFDSAHAMAVALESATDLASIREVATWVQELVGPALATRAERIAHVEELRVDDVTPQQSSPRSAPSPISNRSAEVASTPTVVARIAAPVPPKAAESHSRFRGTVAASLTGAAAALVVVYLALPRAGANPVPASTAEAAPKTSPAPPVAPAAVPTDPTRAELSSEKRLVAPEPSAARPTPAHRPEPLAAHGAPRKKAHTEPVPRQLARQGSASEPSPAERAETRPPAPTSTSRPPCDPPYVTDANGFRRFRVECVQPKP